MEKRAAALTEERRAFEESRARQQAADEQVSVSAGPMFFASRPPPYACRLQL